jgi:hypothetical protein
MGRIADYVATLTPAERERFSDLIDESLARESTIAANAAAAEAAVERLAERQRQFLHSVDELRHLSGKLRDTVGRLYLLSVEAKGGVN